MNLVAFRFMCRGFVTETVVIHPARFPVTVLEAQVCLLHTWSYMESL